MDYSTGDKPGIGKYRCRYCDEIIHIKDDDEALPVCPKCGQTGYKKIA